MELEPAGAEFQAIQDARPRLFPPPPAQLVAIADVALPAIAGHERELDAFYVGLLKLERDHDQDQDGQQIVYRAENFRLRLIVHETPPIRQDYRPLGVVVPSLDDLTQHLNDAEIKFTRQRGILPGTESLSLSDPSGNGVEVTESRMVM